jgi:hypothetical protein
LNLEPYYDMSALSSSNVMTVIALGAALGVAVVGGSWYLNRGTAKGAAEKKKGGKKKKKKGGKKKKGKSKSKVAADTVVKILAEINTLLARTCTALVNYEAQVRAKAAGQVTEKELRDHISQTFMQELKKFEGQVYKKFNTSQDAVKQSIDVLGDHAGIARQVAATKAIFAEVRKGNMAGAAGAAGGGGSGMMGGPVAPLPAGFGRSQALDMLRKVMDHICVSIDKVAEEMRPDGSPVGNSPAALQEFNTLFQMKTETKAVELCKKAGISKEVREDIFNARARTHTHTHAHTHTRTHARTHARTHTPRHAPGWRSRQAWTAAMRSILLTVIVGGSAASDDSILARAATISGADEAPAMDSSGAAAGASIRSITFSVPSFWML